MLVSIVIPCYNSEHSIKKTVELTVEEFKKLPGYECEFVLVNDYSKDGTFASIKELCGKYPFVKGINLSRNFGQHNAIMAGLNYAEGDYIIGMDDDLQTHPSQIPKLIGKIEEGYDVVFGHFTKTKFGFFKKLTSKIASFLTWHMIKRPKGIQASNFWICRKFVPDEIVQYKNYNLYLQVLFYRIHQQYRQCRNRAFRQRRGKIQLYLQKAFNTVARLFELHCSAVKTFHFPWRHLCGRRSNRSSDRLYTETAESVYSCWLGFSDVCTVSVFRRHLPDAGNYGRITLEKPF